MVELKKFKIGDQIITKARWKCPFIVEVIYKDFVVAVNRRSTINPVFLFIKTYTGEVYFGSSRFLKHGINNKTSIKKFIDKISIGEYKFNKDNCIPAELFFTETAFNIKERKEQVKYGSEEDRTDVGRV